MPTATNEPMRLSEYCERFVLPALFGRLDQAFPEFDWTRTATGWLGALRTAASAQPESVYCRQPWGFVTEDGQTQSWLAYVDGGSEPTGEALIQSIRKLARLAGIGDTVLNGEFSPEEKDAASRRERSRQLFEAFASYSHLALSSPTGAAATEYLKEHYGFTTAEIRDLPIGYYTSCQDIVDYLEGVGFSRQEILDARAMTDPQLAGRVIVPWRDRWGNIQSIVAHSCLEELGEQPRRLYLKCGDLSEPFGLNTALRSHSDACDNLVIVEDELAALLFQVRGFPHVASFGSPGRVPTTQQWESLADYGVQSVTLAFYDNAAGYQRTRAAIDSAHKAERAPALFALPHRALGRTRRPQEYLQRSGGALWQRLVDNRVHAYHFVARTILRKNKRGPWTDDRLMATLVSSLEFDAQSYTPERELNLDRFFWQVILDATSAYWPAVRYLLPHRKDTLLRNRPGKWSLARCQEQLRKLEQAQLSGDPQKFTNLIWAAACELAALEENRSEVPVPLPRPNPVRTRPVRSKPQRARAAAPLKPAARPTASKLFPSPAKSSELPRFTAADVRRTAYLMWEQNGRPVGKDEQFWLEAEQLLRRLGLLRD